MKKKITSLCIAVLLLLGIFAYTYAPKQNLEQAVLGTFQQTSVKKVSITASTLNVRAGKGTQFPVITKVYKGQVIDVIGKLDDWYVIHLSDDMVGVISGSYAKPVTESTTPTTPSQPSNSTNQMTNEQRKMLELVNNERAKAGMKPLTFDAELARVANFKAQDMVERNYFSHTSPTYGSPFDMMKNFGIKYSYAGENLAGYSTVEAAHNGLMNSEGHRKNILNTNYNYIGIGVAKSPKYGYIFVQMFVGR